MNIQNIRISGRRLLHRIDRNNYKKSLGIGAGVVTLGVVSVLFSGQIAGTRTVNSNTTSTKLAATTPVKPNVSAKTPSGSSSVKAAETTDANSTTSSAPATSSTRSTASTAATPSSSSSTTGSTTPVASVPASVNITITHSGQVPVGTLISYNANKGEKAYYGGDLILSSNSVTVSKSNSRNLPITISIPDAVVSTSPKEPYNDRCKVLCIGFIIDAGIPPQPLEGTSWQMYLTPYPGLSNLPNGSYYEHVISYRAGQAADAWEYDGFVQITLTD